MTIKLYARTHGDAEATTVLIGGEEEERLLHVLVSRLNYLDYEILLEDETGEQFLYEDYYT
jgi:hypothetical protein